MTMSEAAGRLGLSRTRLNTLVKAGDIPSRLEITEGGQARRVMPRAKVEAYLAARQKAAEEPAGKGRPIKLPSTKRPENLPSPTVVETDRAVEGSQG